MENTIKKEFYETISEFKKIIKINKSKIPEYYLDKDLFADTKDKLEKNVYSDSMLHTKYIDLLQEFGRFINKYDINLNPITA